ncbi:MAG: hypothetical protein R3Y05_06565 [bacterium]
MKNIILNLLMGVVLIFFIGKFISPYYTFSINLFGDNSIRITYRASLYIIVILHNIISIYINKEKLLKFINNVKQIQNKEENKTNG